MTEILKTENLTKDYGQGKGAFDINIEIKTGEIVGFIGPNGAGKTTTLKLITKLIQPNYGELELLGHKISTANDYLKVSKQIGFLPSEGGLYDNVTAGNFLKYACDLYEINKDKEIQTLANDLKLDLNMKIKNLSMGNKRKVGILQSLIHKPKFLILDEPTSGLDPLIQKQVLDLIKIVKKDGGSVFLSSHNLAEVESVCDRIIMIKEGKIIFNGKSADILKKSLKKFRIENVSREFFNKIKVLKSIKKIDYVTDDIIAFVDDTKEVIDFLAKNNNYNFYIERPTLEEAFIEYY